MKHGKNFILGEYVIIKKPELVEVGDNVRIADFCRISSACKIGSDCEIAPGTYIAGGDGKYTFEMGSYSSLAAGVNLAVEQRLRQRAGYPFGSLRQGDSG